MPDPASDKWDPKYYEYEGRQVRAFLINKDKDDTELQNWLDGVESRKKVLKRSINR